MHSGTEPPVGRHREFLSGGGEMGALMRAYDWSATPLGDPAGWPQALRTAVRLLLNCAHPMYIFWGPQGTCFYNDAYRLSIGPERHPGSLGQPARAVWEEIWEIIGPQIEQVMAGGGATWHENALVPITRNGKREDVYWTYTYSPIDDETAPNSVGGVLVVCSETTRAVLSERRQGDEVQRQRRLFEQAPGFIVIMRGPEHVVEFVNDAHRKVFNSEGWVDKTIRQAFPSLEGQGFFELLDKVYATGETFEATGAEVRFRKSPDAPEETHFLTFIYAPLYGDNQSITGIFCEGFDVTEAHVGEKHTKALADLGDRIREIDDADELAYAAAEILGRTMGVSRAGYGTIDVAEETIAIERDWNMPGVQSLAGLLHFRDYGSYIEDLKRGTTVVLADAYNDPRTAAGADALKAISAQSFVNMPVTEQGGFVALLYLNHVDAREWSEGELSLIRDVAERTRTAVERRRAETALRKNEERLRFLDTLARETAKLGDADAILAATTRLVGEHMGVAICAYADMDEDQDGFTIRGDWAAPGSHSIVGHYSLADFGKLAVKNLGAGLPLVVNDNLRELAPEEAATFQSIGISATICMPLVKKGRLTALMAIHDKVPRVWTDEELSLIREVTERSWAHIERVGSEAELRSSEENFRTLTRAMPNQAWTSPPDGMLDWFNEQVYAYSGAAQGTLDGTGWAAIVHPDDVPEAGAAWAKALASGQTYETDFRLRRADGAYRWHIARAVAIKDAAGQVMRWIGTNTDIHDQMEVAETLANINVELERQVMERTHVGGRTWQLSSDLLCVTNAQGQLENTNPAWTITLGWSQTELDGQPLFGFLHPDDVERTNAGIAQLARGEPVLRFENRYRTKTGDYKWLSWIAVPEGDKFYCSARDITSDKAAEAERDQLWTLSEDMLARADYSGGMSAVNPAWTKVLGWSEHELLTNPYADIINPDDVPATVAALGQMGETGQPTRFENRILTKDNQWKPIGWTVSPEPDGVNFIAVGRDLSDYKARERELMDTQEALRQAQKMEAVGQLTGGIAHDFNNLLGGISGSLELLEKRLAEGRHEGVERYISSARDSSRRAASLTQRLLAFSRRQTLDPRPIDANKMIAGMEELIRRTVGPTVEVEVVGAGGLWATKVDPSQLENSLLNLCINARDAMAPNGGRLTIETANKWLDDRAARERELPPGQYVSVCVTDTGTGMTPEVIARAFDPFFTTKPLGEGTGLGLSMIYGFVRQSGGQVRIYSEIGKGTTMCLYLPRHLGAAEEEIDQASTAATGAGGGETVLVIDDEPILRMLITDVLQEAGYNALEAKDGPSGLKILQSNARIDLLITDVGLPGGMNGRQVVEAARVTRPDLKVLFITGYAENAVLSHGHLAPGTEVMTKPFEISAMAAKIHDMIER